MAKHDPTTHEFTRTFTITITFQEGDDDVGLGEGYFFEIGGLEGDGELYETSDEAKDAAESFINDLDA